MYKITGINFVCTYDPETVALSVTSGEENFSWNQNARIVLDDGSTVFFRDAKAESAPFQTGVTEGVRATYSGFAGKDIIIYTSVSADVSGRLRFEVRAEGMDEKEIAELYWPCGFSYDSEVGYTVMPRMQGILIPARYDRILPLNNHTKGDIFDRAAYMPIFGQKKKNAGYLAIYDTPFDAQYEFMHTHGGDTTVAPLFIPSLGSFADKRVMLYSFFENCNYVVFAKAYKQYLKETGKFITLKEKIAKNEAVAGLIGTPIIHEKIATHICPGTHFYDNEHPEKNDECFTFDYRAEQLRELKKKGVDRAYLHFDGWGRRGYDNQHPDIFPPNEEAGGAEGMKRLSDTAQELGYIFGVHDQYRDYYYDADSFDMENAVTLEDGSHPYCAIWHGGEHTFLCQAFAPEYVRRNYKTFEELGIKIDAAYLDVFSIVPMDECFHPDHRMTRKESCEKRIECYDALTSMGIIPSSEEAIDCMMKGIVLCHHAPYFAYSSVYRAQKNELFGEAKKDAEDKPMMFGIPIPLFNLVWHESLVIPWTRLNDEDEDRWEGVPYNDSPYLYALLNGDTIYLRIDATEADIEKSKAVLDLHKKVALCEMVSHEFLDDTYRVQKTVFSDGTKVVVDFEKKNFRIEEV